MNTDTIGTHAAVRPQTNDRAAASLVRQSQTRQARFKVAGISCESDASRIEHRLSRQVGVIGVSVNLITDIAYVAYDPTITSSSILLRQIEFSGFSAVQR